MHHLVTWCNAVSYVIQIIQQVVRKVHVCDALFRYARQLWFVSCCQQKVASSAQQFYWQMHSCCCVCHYARPQCHDWSCHVTTPRVIVVWFLAERETPPLGAGFRDTQVLCAIGTSVLMPCQVPPVQVYKEECEAANQNTGGAEVVACLPTTANINVTWNRAMSVWSVWMAVTTMPAVGHWVFLSHISLKALNMSCDALMWLCATRTVTFCVLHYVIDEHNLSMCNFNVAIVDCSYIFITLQ